MDGWSVQQQGNPKRAAAKKAVVSKAAKAIAKIGEKVAKLTVRKIWSTTTNTRRLTSGVR